MAKCDRDRTVYRLTPRDIEVGGKEGWAPVPPEIRLRMALKLLLRTYKLKCLSVSEERQGATTEGSEP
jgi:hypothetical protein